MKTPMHSLTSLLSAGLLLLPACAAPGPEQTSQTNSGNSNDDDESGEEEDDAEEASESESNEETSAEGNDESGSSSGSADDDGSTGGAETSTTDDEDETTSSEETGEVDYCASESLDIPMEDTGWVGRDCTPYGIQGAWYCYDDGVAETNCETNEPPYADGAMCLSGSTIEDDTFAAWGAGIGLSLGDTGGDNSVKEPWNATENGVIGFEVEITGDSGGLPIRVQLSRTAEDETAPFREVPGAGTYEIMLEDVIIPSWDESGPGEPGDPIDPTALYDLQIQVVGAEAEADYEICVVRVTPISDGSTTDTTDDTGSDELEPFGQEQCNALATIEVGGFTVQNNVWNESASGRDQCIQALEGGGDVGFIVQANNVASSSGNEVVSYPSVALGWHYGTWHGDYTSARRLSEVNAIPSSWSYDKGDIQKFNVAYDIWVHPTESNPSTPSGGTEVMIWVDYRGEVYPIGTDTGNTFTDAEGRSWNIWSGTTSPQGDGTWNVVTFIRSGGQSPIELDVKEFIERAGEVTDFGDAYLLGVEAGFEIFEGQDATASTTRYNVSID